MTPVERIAGARQAPLRRPRAIVTGMIATYPVGGVFWDYGQYAVGLERLGWDVFYLEDTGSQTYDPDTREYTDDSAYGVEFLRQSLPELSPTLASRWHVRTADGLTHGTSVEECRGAIDNADLFLNVSGSALLRPEYMAVPCKVLIDTDPGWNQFVNYPRWDANPGWLDTLGFRRHDAFFSYAEGYGRAGCRLPSLGLPWHPTRPVVIPELWSPQPPADRWTTVMTWDNFKEPIEYGGEHYGTKEMEFPKIADLPRHVNGHFEIASGGTPPREAWRAQGWSVVDSHDVSRTPETYRDYLERSRGELSVAKNVYVATRSGWFSCRSACYLAAGRPVVLQDTGFSDVIPVANGLFAFSTLAEAIDAVRTVEADYDTHSAAARTLAIEHFGHDVVLTAMLSELGFAENDGVSRNVPAESPS